MKNRKLTKSIVAAIAIAALMAGPALGQEKGYTTTEQRTNRVGTMVPNASTTVMAENASTQQTYIGEIDYIDQTLTMESTHAMAERMRLQRVSQLYMWAYPMVQFQNVMEVAYSSLNTTRDKINVGLFQAETTYPFFSPNMVTPYTISSLDLSVTGPVVIDLPEGHLYGVINDAWQQPIQEWGGPASAGKYLIVGPNQDFPADFDGKIVQSPTFKHAWMYRALGANSDDLQRAVKAYPLKEADAPRANEFITYKWKEGDVTNTAPDGMAFWEMVNDHVQMEAMQDRDRFFYGWLADLGIEKGQKFNPTDAQKAIFLEGMKVGKAMTQANSVERKPKRHTETPDEYGNSTWTDLFSGLDPKVDIEHMSLFDQRLSYLSEGSTLSSGMTSRVAGKGSAYLTAYYDDASRPLQGSKHYTLHVEADIPAATFWSMTVYNMDDKLIIHNDGTKVDINGNHKDIVVNEDGTMDLHFSPTQPEGVSAANWVQTNPEKSWFTYFRLYGPTQTFFDASWVMNNIQEVKGDSK